MRISPNFSVNYNISSVIIEMNYPYEFCLFQLEENFKFADLFNSEFVLLEFLMVGISKLFHCYLF